MSTIPSLALIPSGVKASKVYSVLPTDGSGDFDFTRSGNATRVNSEGLIELVSSNVPRLNYPLIDGVVSGCPSLLLEPQRINYIFPSNGFSSWSLGGVVTRTANYGISPDGTQNSTRADFSNGGIIFRTPSRPQGAYVFSVFAKNIEGGGSEIVLRIDIPASKVAVFDLSNGTIVSNNTDDAKIEYYGNGWYRCIVIQDNDSIDNVVIGDGSELDCEIFGAMLEQGIYVTSYIPTTTEAVTRSAETCNKTLPSGIIGQTEGTLFADIYLNLAGSNVGFFALKVYDNSFSPSFGKAVYLELYQGRVYGYVRNSTVQCEIFSGIYADGQRLKMALAYKSNDFALYVNGIQIGIATNGGLPSVLNDVSLHYSESTQQASPLSQAQLYNTRLSNEELAALTTL